jgi:hypothetical protein
MPSLRNRSKRRVSAVAQIRLTPQRARRPAGKLVLRYGVSRLRVQTAAVG